MLEFILASQNMPFTVALTVMLGMAVLEGVMTLLGAGISSFLDSLLPDIDVDMDVDLGSDSDLGASEVPAATPLSKVLSWLQVGKVPVLILLVIFLTGFGLIGLTIQSFMHSTTGMLLPGIVASGIAFFLSMPVVRVFGGAIGKIIPKDETDAVSVKTLIGRIAVITIGTAKKGSPAEAKVKDQHGLTHYIMVEPEQDNDVFTSGTAILLIKQGGSVFKAIENTNPALVDD